MQQLHEDTLEKVTYLKDQGFRVIEMWECELKKEMDRDEDMKRYFEEHELVDLYNHVMHFTEDVPMLQNYFTYVKKMKKLGNRKPLHFTFKCLL